MQGCVLFSVHRSPRWQDTRSACRRFSSRPRLDLANASGHAFAVGIKLVERVRGVRLRQGMRCISLVFLRARGNCPRSSRIVTVVRMPARRNIHDMTAGCHSRDPGDFSHRAPLGRTRLQVAMSRSTEVAFLKSAFLARLRWCHFFTRRDRPATRRRSGYRAARTTVRRCRTVVAHDMTDTAAAHRTGTVVDSAAMDAGYRLPLSPAPKLPALAPLDFRPGARRFAGAAVPTCAT